MDDTVERVARMVARAYGYGDGWFTGDVQWQPDKDTQGVYNPRLTVTRETYTLEQAGVGNRVREFRQWSQAIGIAAVPRTRLHSDTLGALAFANLDGPLEPMLRLYACQDSRQWQIVERYALACIRGPGAQEAITDAMHRLLWRVPAVPLRARAKSLGIRVTRYAAIRQAADQLLWRWLEDASRRVLDAMGNGQSYS